MVLPEMPLCSKELIKRSQIMFDYVVGPKPYIDSNIYIFIGLMYKVLNVQGACYLMALFILHYIAMWCVVYLAPHVISYCGSINQ